MFKNENAHSVFGEDLVGRNCFEVIKGGEQVCENGCKGVGLGDMNPPVGPGSSDRI